MNLLVADIGGTNARFGFQKNVTSEIKYINYLKCKDYTNIDDALDFYINSNKLKIDNMVLAVAGPCGNNIVKLTNNNWKFNKIELSKKFKVKSFLAVNDFVAQAISFTDFFISKKTNYSKEFLNQFNLKLIKKGNTLKNSNLLVTGPGTGLGVCTLTSFNNCLIPIEGEGGNVNFSPQNKIEIELLEFLLKEKNYVSFEDLVSGRGLQNIYKFKNIKNDQVYKKIDASQIGELALNNNAIAKESVKLMFSILGTFISNNILINGCQKGVIIAGGIINKLDTLLDQSDFFYNLINKGAYKKYVDNVPIFFSHDENNGLKGSAKCFNNKYFTKYGTIYNI